MGDELAGDTEADDRGHLPGERIQCLDGMDAGAQDLEDSRRLVRNTGWYGNQAVERDHGVLGEHPVDIPAEQTTVHAYVEATRPAHVTPSAGNTGVDQDPGAGLIRRLRRRSNHLADHLMAHDPWVVHRDLAGQDLDIGAADPDLANPDQDRGPGIGLGHIAHFDDSGRLDTDRSHNTPRRVSEW